MKDPRQEKGSPNDKEEIMRKSVDADYECGENEDPSGWTEIGETEATVVELGGTREGLAKWEDDDMAYHFWIYEYTCLQPDTAELHTFRGRIRFVGSIFGNWFQKYPKGFKFPVHYNKADPAHHIRLHNFD